MDNEALREEVRLLLKRTGWGAADMRHIEYYANMAPEKKLQRLWRLRNLQVRAIKARLRDENPDCTKEELRKLFLDHLDSLRDPKPYFGARRTGEENAPS